MVNDTSVGLSWNTFFASSLLRRQDRRIQVREGRRIPSFSGRLIHISPPPHLFLGSSLLFAGSAYPSGTGRAAIRSPIAPNNRCGRWCREIDCVLVWRLDRWGRSLADLVNTLQELTAIEVGFVSLCEALDLTTPSGRALAGMLAVFAEFEWDILRDRVKAGIDRARKDGKPHGRPLTAAKLVPEMKQLRKDGLSKREIAKRLEVSHASVIRLLDPSQVSASRDHRTP